MENLLWINRPFSLATHFQFHVYLSRDCNVFNLILHNTSLPSGSSRHDLCNAFEAPHPPRSSAKGKGAVSRSRQQNEAIAGHLIMQPIPFDSMPWLSYTDARLHHHMSSQSYRSAERWRQPGRLLCDDMYPYMKQNDKDPRRKRSWVPYEEHSVVRVHPGLRCALRSAGVSFLRHFNKRRHMSRHRNIRIHSVSTLPRYIRLELSNTRKCWIDLAGNIFGRSVFIISDKYERS